MPTRIDEGACRRVQAKLDSYIDHELLTETNLEFAEHFERCATCAQEAAARRAVRAKLQSAVRQTSLPPDLENRVRARLGETGRKDRPPWLMMIAAAVVVCVAWAASRPDALPQQVLALLRIGLRDHVHCAVVRQRSNPARAVHKLPAEYKAVLQTVRVHIPFGMQLAVAGAEARHFPDLYRLRPAALTQPPNPPGARALR